MEKQFIRSLTPLRGIAALFVVILHTTTSPLSNLGIFFSKHTAFFLNGYLWVDFFFILSGFILAHNYANLFLSGISPFSYKKFIFARFARIYPLHLFVLSAFVGLELIKLIKELIIHGVSGYMAVDLGEDAPFSGSRSLFTLFTNTFLVQALTIDPRATSWNHPAWSISTEWHMYLLFPFFLPFFYKFSRLTLSSVVVFAGILFGLFIIAQQTHWQLDIAGFIGLARCILESAFGVMIYRLYQDQTLQHLYKKGSVFILSLVWIGIVMHFNFQDVLIIPAFALLILSASHNEGIYSKFLNSGPLTFLGDISYSIYMVHILALNLTAMFWWKTFHTEFGVQFGLLESLGALFVFIAITLGLSTLTYKYVELPMRNFLKQTSFAKRYIFQTQSA